ncbi:ADP-ribosylation factor family/Ras of Complex, Roc, domain of DAPkinase/Ras family, putative [Angomonas deanei]|uniref:ADP-ribosylation factor family/Ras of Complex, Roc, domain of DAPkinase/Ras family, putative n=1 Tax=Angomonas deanei TaxID=59799 RepID=A0A7G2CKJ1_9TRYP|nr:ADP-ribosylation factor family/Ras of Complex, Roc, domain of DAPkinase/Ras family, putative [Angomonas deanei]
MQPPATLDYPRIKVLFVGDATVGKSCLIKRFCEGRFVNKYIPTIGIDYGVKKIDINPKKYTDLTHQNNNNNNNNLPLQVRVNFWDVAGSAECFEIRNEFYAATQGIILVYDVTSRDSFDHLQQWWEELLDYIPLLNNNNNNRRPSGPSATASTAAGKMVDNNNKAAPPVIVLLGNKCDSSNNNAKRAVSEEEGKKWAAAHGGIPYYDVSASEEKNVAESLEYVFYNVLARFFM